MCTTKWVNISLFLIPTSQHNVTDNTDFTLLRDPTQVSRFQFLWFWVVRISELCANTHWDLPLLTPALKSISYIQRWCKRNNVSCCTSLKQDYDHLEQNNDMQWFVFTTVFIIWESGLYLWNIWTWCCLKDCQARYNWLTILILFGACWRILP